MNQIARWDWLPERARWSYLARSGLPAVSRKQNFTKSHIINPLLTKFVRSRWLYIDLVLFLFMDLDFVSVHKQAKKELGQYPAILTSHLVNNPYLLDRHTDDGVFDDFRRFSTTFRRFSKIIPKARRTFPNTFREFPKISEDVQRFPKIAEDFRGRPKYVSMIHQRI